MRLGSHSLSLATQHGIAVLGKARSRLVLSPQAWTGNCDSTGGLVSQGPQCVKWLIFVIIIIIKKKNSQPTCDFNSDRTSD